MAVAPEQSLLDVNARECIERWLSPARFSPYLVACDGDVENALDLYLWNVGICQILMADLSHFEVALRNAYDRVLQEGWSGKKHWLLDDDSPVRTPIIRRSKSKRLLDVNVVNRKAIAQAQGRSHDSNDPSQIISNLTLGFWSHLTDRSRERDLWIPYLYTAWPRGTNRKALNSTIDSINKVRNRVAHNERLFDSVQDELLPTVIDASIIRLMRDFCPDAAERLYGEGAMTSVEHYVQVHPAPVAVKYS